VKPSPRRLFAPPLGFEREVIHWDYLGAEENHLREGCGSVAVTAITAAGPQFQAGWFASERQVNSAMSFSDIVTYYRTRFGVEDGQTMAEYGVVLAVITIGVFLALGALAGGISGAITTVTGYL
jgi:Flp pilus assembly pilin Flp